MIKYLVLGSRGDTRIPCLSGLELETISLDADPSVEGTALGDEKCTGQLNITGDNRWSSVFMPSPNFDKFIGFSRNTDQNLVRSVPVELKRGDDVFCNLSDNFIMYINAQGSTDAIIKGFGKKISQCCLAFVEIEFNEQYEGAPLFGEVATTFNKNGFELLDINPVRAYYNTKIFRQKFLRTRPGRPTLFWGDAIFLNKSSILALSREDFNVIVTVLLRLGFLSLVFRLAEDRNSDLKPILNLIAKIQRPFMIKILPKWLRKYLYEKVTPLSLVDLTVVEKKHSFVKDLNRIDRAVKY